MKGRGFCPAKVKVKYELAGGLSILFWSLQKRQVLSVMREGRKMFAAAICLDQAVCCALHYGAALALPPSRNPSGVESLTQIWILAALRWALVRLFCAVVPKSGSNDVLHRYLTAICLLSPVYESGMLVLFGKHPEHWSGSLSSPGKTRSGGCHGYRLPLLGGEPSGQSRGVL
ncbi:hypothetical protein ANANG_G00318930 [Anguilla anguilla]|uniref:Uncharacterized protein n=1 Tax=Anguilla anguilla TaxID=7936 RepID=A0A9D3LHI2_ANGAN|nr:hypothetical protein ANANG_G00318930 [Anguilla anguilla]